jgi:transcription antitermination factor NusG
MLKLSENPPLRPPSLASIAHTTATWCVRPTKARMEKSFAWDLLQLGIDYFLPLAPRTIFSGGRKRKSFVPLFPSYVFFCGTAEQRVRAFGTDRICNAIEVKERQQFVSEITSIERALDCGSPIDLFPEAVAGRRVRVAAGPLAGITGRILRRDGVDRLILEVNILGQCASVPIEVGLVEILDSAA